MGLTLVASFVLVASLWDAGRFGPIMDRPGPFSEFRWLGDKRTQRVYDLDEATDSELIAEIVESGRGQTFGPDTLAEARNRGYRPGSA